MLSKLSNVGFLLTALHALHLTGGKKLRKKPSKPEDEQVKQLQQRLDSSKEAGPSGLNGRYSREDPEKLAAVKGRTWKAGSGTRPGTFWTHPCYGYALWPFN
jgi:hypothetical protein